MDQSFPKTRAGPWLSLSLLVLGCAGFAALWVLAALYADRQLGWMALLGALDAAVLVRLGGMRRGASRAALAVAATAAIVALANWGIAAGQIGTVMGLLPWESLLKLGPRYAWTLAQLANGTTEWLCTGAALALAAWLSR